jgi:hypothetical protein
MLKVMSGMAEGGWILPYLFSLQYTDGSVYHDGK